MEHTVSPAWLSEHLDDPHLRVVDCRYVLGARGEGRARYLGGHIPGAVHLDLDTDLSGPVGDGMSGRHPLPAAEAFQAAARRAGICDDSLVVAYDESSTGGAARLWWLLRHHGHERVVVLDGGLDAWSGPLATGEEAVPRGDVHLGPGRDDDAVTYGELLRGRAGRGDRVLLDARAPERYRGEVEPIDPLPGRIPGARNVPYQEPLPPDLAEIEGEVVVYCGSGVTSCVVVHRLAQAGKSAKLYPGSYSEWSSRGLPVERD